MSIKSTRITLRHIQESDADAIFAYRSLPEVAKFQYWEPFTREQIVEFIEKNSNADLASRDNWIGLAVILNEGDKLIGDCALKISKESAEIGCNISPEYQNRGYAKEVLALLIEYCFQNTDIIEVCGITDSENIASIRLMESLGMKKSESFENRIECKGAICTEYKYLINK